MKIYRDFVSMYPGQGTCRVEIELTPQEMSDAYYEKEHEWDENYVIGLAEMSADAEIDGTEERLLSLRSDPELLSRVAHRYRKYMDEWVDGEVEGECFRDAWRYIAENYVKQNPV